MRRGQATLEALFAVLLIGIVLVAGLAVARQGFTAARTTIDAAALPSADQPTTRRGQATVELIVLLPLVVLTMTLLVAGWLRLAEVARAERALGAAQAAIAAGEPIGTLGDRWQAQVTRDGDRLVVRVPSHLGDVVRDVELPAVP